MKITKEYLEKINACQPAMKEYVKNGEPKTLKKCFKLLIENNKLDWANWLICKIFNKKQKIQYAIFAAEQVLCIFEEKYLDDKRPRMAIEAAKKYLENPNADAAYAADAAAYAAAAAAAAHAADAAADAAYAAAYAAHAADAAAYAADAADAAADAAYAADAAHAAYAAKLRIKILKYGFDLLKIKF